MNWRQWLRQSDFLANPRLTWLGAILLALVWHGAWAVWLSVANPLPPAARPPAPTVSYITPGAEPARAEVRQLWSPVLFALSSPAGFSRAVLDGEAAIRPPLNPPSASSNLLEHLLPLAPAAALPAGRSLRDDAAQRLAGFPDSPPPPSLFPPTTASELNPVQVEFTGGLAGAEFARLDLPDNPRARDATAWEARLWLEFDPAGGVRHVFLDPPTESAQLNLYLLHLAQNWRLRNPGGPRGGWVILRNPGAARLAAGAGKVAP